MTRRSQPASKRTRRDQTGTATKVMEILRSRTLNLTPERMLVQQGHDATKGTLSPGIMRLYQEAADQARTLVDPVAMLVGLGNNVPTKHELAQCDFCPRKDTCANARLRRAHAWEQA